MRDKVVKLANFLKQKFAFFNLKTRFGKLFLAALVFLITLIVFWLGRNFFADLYFKKALKSRLIGNEDQAIILSQRAIKIFPRDSDYWRLIGEIKWHQADTKLREVKSISDQSTVQTRINNITREDAGSALTYLERARDLDPYNWQNHAALGNFYESFVAYVPEAEKMSSFSFLHAAELNPENLSMQVAALRNLIFYADRLAAQNRHNEKNQALLLAQNVLKNVKNRKLSDSIYSFYHGLILLRSLQYDKAILELKAASKLMPDNAYLLFEIGVAYYAQGDLVNARAFLSLDIIKNSPYARQAKELLELSG